MIKTVNHLIFIICCITIYILFAIKSRVRILDYQVNEARKQIVEEQDKINFLKAEFAYLVNPDRLRKLSCSHLELSDVKGTQMIKDPLATAAIPEKPIVQNSRKSATIKWRYKKAPSKYMQLAAHRSR